jgi:hypothetical protein
MYPKKLEAPPITTPSLEFLASSSGTTKQGTKYESGSAARTTYGPEMFVVAPEDVGPMNMRSVRTAPLAAAAKVLPRLTAEVVDALASWSTSLFASPIPSLANRKMVPTL